MIVVRNRDFGLLWSSATLSQLGDWLLVVALPVHVYALTGSVTATSLTVVAETAPALLLAPVAGVAVDRWDRRTVIIAGRLISGGIVLALLAVGDIGHLWLVYLLVFAENAVSQFVGPAHRAILPAIVGRDDDLESANAWYGVSSGVVRLAGAPIGGALYVFLGFHAVVVVDAGSYVGSAPLLLAVRYRRPAGVVATVRPGSGFVGQWRAELRGGLSYLFRHPVLRPLLAVSSLFLLANGMLTVLVVPYVADVLHGGAPELGLLMSALGAGYLFGAPLGRAMSRSGRLRRSAVGALVAVAACFAGLFNIPVLAAAVAFIGLAGIPGGALLLLIQVQVQRRTPDDLLGRVSSSFTAAEMAATICGAGLGGQLAPALGLLVTADIAIPLVAITAVLALLRLPRWADAQPARPPDHRHPQTVHDGR